MSQMWLDLGIWNLWNHEGEKSVQPVRKHVTSKLKEDGKLGNTAKAIEKQEPKDVSALAPTRNMFTIDVEGQDKDGNKTVDPIKDCERKEEQRGFDIKHNKEFEAWQK